MEGGRRGAQESPKREEEDVGSVREKLAEYVRTEYPELSSQNGTFLCFPANLEELLDKKDLGDSAELAVFERLREAARIPGLSVTLFHGRSYAGSKAEGALIPREVDFGAFLRYKDKFKVLILEVKGSQDGSEEKSLSSTRRHAMNQLRDHKDIFGYEHNIPESVLQQISLYTAWPNLSSSSFCDSCKDNHETFQPKPDTCKKKGNNMKAQQTNQLFSEDLASKVSFNSLTI